MSGLSKVRTKESDALLLKLLSSGHSNAYVLSAALDEVERREIAAPAETLSPLCQHHRRQIREAARRIQRKLGRPAPGAFDPVQTVRSAPIRQWMARLAEELAIPIAPSTPYVEVTYSLERGKKHWEWKVSGWLIEDSPQSYLLLDPHGWLTFVPREIRPSRENNFLSGSPAISDIDVADEVSRAVKLRRRAAKDRKSEDSDEFWFDDERMRWARGATPYEFLLAYGTYSAKRYDLAARVLLPALDTLYADELAVGLTVDEVASRLGHQMLSCFAGQRNYDWTLQYARLIAREYPNSRFAEVARRLTAQIPIRTDDFKTLVLPTPDEWSNLREHLSRHDQIEFLCKRMRLLNCFQNNSPGSVDPGDPQFREPGEMAREATWGGHSRDCTPLVNPYSLLTGFRSLQEEKTGENEQTAFQLTVEDLASIAPFLKEDWFLPSVEYWQKGQPNRGLLRTRPIFCRLINDVAKHELCDVHRLDEILEHPGDEIRIEAALLLLQAEKSPRAREVLSETLGKDEPNFSDHQIVQVFSVLLAEGSKESIELAKRLLNGQDLTVFAEYGPIVRKMFVEAGLPDGYRQYLSLLRWEANQAKNDPENSFYPDIAEEITTQFAPDDPVVNRIAKEHEEDPLAQNAALQKWLTGRIKEID